MKRRENFGRKREEMMLWCKGDAGLLDDAYQVVSAQIVKTACLDDFLRVKVMDFLGLDYHAATVAGSTADQVDS